MPKNRTEAKQMAEAKADEPAQAEPVAEPAVCPQCNQGKLVITETTVKRRVRCDNEKCSYSAMNVSSESIEPV